MNKKQIRPKANCTRTYAVHCTMYSIQCKLFLIERPDDKFSHLKPHQAHTAIKVWPHYQVVLVMTRERSHMERSVTMFSLPSITFMTVHEIFRVVLRFPCYISCYIAESRLPLGQCSIPDIQSVRYNNILYEVACLNLLIGKKFSVGLQKFYYYTTTFPRKPIERTR